MNIDHGIDQGFRQPSRFGCFCGDPTVLARRALRLALTAGILFSAARQAISQELDSTSIPYGAGVGVSVDVRNDVAAVGAYKDRTAEVDAGSVLLYAQGETNWVPATVLYQEPARAHAMFGFSVALGEDLLVVGAPGDSRYGMAAGAVHFFERTGPTNWTERSVVHAATSPWDRYGYSVDVGRHVVIGAPMAADGENHCGRAHIFSPSPSGWTHSAVLSPPDRQPWQRFGHSMATSSNLVAVGAPHSDLAATNGGAVYVFCKTGSDWTLQSTLIPPDAKPGDLFGSAVSITDQYLAVGAVGEDRQGPNSGSVHVYEQMGSNWTHQAQFAGTSTAAGDAFGWSLSMSGNLLAVGARRHGELDTQGGAAYLFALQNGEWTQLQEFEPDDIGDWDVFGCAISVTTTNTLVGAERHKHGTVLRGGAYLFDNP